MDTSRSTAPARDAGRPGRRRRALQVGALATAVALVWPVVDGPARDRSAVVVETPIGSAAAELAVQPDRVPTGQVPDTMLVNNGAVPLWATPECALDRWEGGEWVDQGRTHFSPPAEITPGRAGEQGSCLGEATLGVGRYRVRWQVTAGGPELDQPRLVVADEFEVVAPASHEAFEPLPTTARPATAGEMPRVRLAVAMGLQEEERPFLMPTSEARSVFISAREGESPTMAATSCDVLSAVQLPDGWSGICLERNFEGRRLSATYPYGTTAIASAGCRVLAREDMRVTTAPVGVPLEPAIRASLDDEHRLAGPVMAVRSPGPRFETPWTVVAAEVATADGDRIGVGVWMSPDHVATFAPDNRVGISIEEFQSDPAAHLTTTHVSATNEIADRVSEFERSGDRVSTIPRAEECARTAAQ